MRKLILGSILMVVSTALALGQEGPPKPAPEMANLKYFAGTWSCNGDSPAGPFGPAHKTQGTLTLKADLDGFWYVGTATEKKTASNPHPVKGMLHVGYDAGAKQYVQLWIDNFGSHAVQMSPGWEGDAIVYTGEQNLMGEKATAKDTLTKKGANEFVHKFELTMKGETHTIVEETCKKAGKM